MHCDRSVDRDDSLARPRKLRCLPAYRREWEVLSLICEGRSNTDIASRLEISEKTVRNYTTHVFGKLGVWSRAQAIVFARDHGFER